MNESCSIMSAIVDSRDLVANRFCNTLVNLYRLKRLRTVVVKLLNQFDVAPMLSQTRREILSRYYDVHVGAYSYGGCLEFGRLPPNVSVGRYVSTASDFVVFRRNHPLDFISLHPFFYNKALGFVETDAFPHSPLVIEHDAWIGSRAIITPGCSRIGIGAVVAAGAVVTKDVPDFGIAMGVPAKVQRFRFGESVKARVLNSSWWMLSIEELRKSKDLMCNPYNEFRDWTMVSSPYS